MRSRIQSSVNVDWIATRSEKVTSAAVSVGRSASMTRLPAAIRWVRSRGVEAGAAVERQHDVQRQRGGRHELDPLRDAVVEHLEVAGAEPGHRLVAAPDVDVDADGIDARGEVRLLRARGGLHGDDAGEGGQRQDERPDAGRGLRPSLQLRPPGLEQRVGVRIVLPVVRARDPAARSNTGRRRRRGSSARRRPPLRQRDAAAADLGRLRAGEARGGARVGDARLVEAPELFLAAPEDQRRVELRERRQRRLQRGPDDLDRLPIVAQPTQDVRQSDARFVQRRVERQGTAQLAPGDSELDPGAIGTAVGIGPSRAGDDPVEAPWRLANGGLPKPSVEPRFRR